MTGTVPVTNIRRIMNPQEMVTEFHKTFGHPAPEDYSTLTAERRDFRVGLIAEEFDELVEATDAGDVIETIDALADIVYVAYGMAIEMGVDLDSVIAEVHASNMRKVWPDGKVHYREDGKVLKPAGWTGPDIARVLNGDDK